MYACMERIEQELSIRGWGHTHPGESCVFCSKHEAIKMARLVTSFYSHKLDTHRSGITTSLLQTGSLWGRSLLHIGKRTLPFLSQQGPGPVCLSVHVTSHATLKCLGFIPDQAPSKVDPGRQQWGL